MANYEEDRLQMACRTWFDLQFPNLAPLLHHSPNEGYLRDPKRDGAKRKAMGVRPGVADFLLLTPRGRWGSLAIELKTTKGRQSSTQEEWQRTFESNGGVYRIARSLDQFATIVTRYLGGSSAV